MCNHRLANENEIKAIQAKVKEVQKQNDDLISQLAKKDRECEIKAEEKVSFIQRVTPVSEYNHHYGDFSDK